MKIHPQIISKKNKAEFIVLPVNEYKKIFSLIEEQQDIEEIKTRIHDHQERFPLKIVEQISNGEHPVKVFREYRGIPQILLASKIRVSKQYISQIENFERQGTIKILKAIAKVLKVDLENLAV